MRNIFVEGVRSAFIRIIRMLVYIVIGIIIFYIIGLFTSKKAHALVYKTDVWNPMNQYSVSGYVAGGSNNQQVINFDINGNTLMTQSLNYDILVFKFNNMNFKQNSDFSGGFTSTDNYLYCTKWVQSGSTYTCSSYSTLGTGGSTSSTTNLTNENNFALSIGKIYLQASLYYNNNVNNKSTCYMSSELQDMFLCPVNKEVNKQITDFEIIITNDGGVGIDYSFELSGLKYGFNYDSTEIVNGLTGVQTAQQQTITIIQQQIDQDAQQNQYMQSDNVTSSMTSANSSFTIMTNEITQQLGSANELTQIVVAPVSMFMELATDSCSPLVLNVPFVNVQATIPCMKPVFNQYFAGLYTIFTTAISAIITYWVSVKTFSLIKDILDCDNDRIEVLDL